MRIVKTGLNSEIGKEVLDSVRGQMSDGIWENSRGYDKYWLCFDVNDDGDLEIEEGTWVHSWKGWVSNPYCFKNDDEIRKFFASKVKQVVKVFLKDCDYWGIDAEKAVWKRDNDLVVRYMGGHCVREVTVADAYRAYDVLMGRKVA